MTVPKSHQKSKKNTLHTCSHNQHRQPTEICHYTSDRASPTRPSSSREGSAGARDEATRTVREDVHRWSKYVAPHCSGGGGAGRRQQQKSNSSVGALRTLRRPGTARNTGQGQPFNLDHFLPLVLFNMFCNCRFSYDRAIDPIKNTIRVGSTAL